MFSWLRVLAPRRARRPLASRYRPRLERLEAREVPAAGRLDPTFGQGHVTALALNNGALGSASVAAAPGGATVLAGTDARGDLVVARLNSAGVLDTTFGTAGEAVIGAGLRQLGGVVVTNAGQIVVAARGTTANLVVARLTARGSLDTSFGTGGAALISAGMNAVSGLALAPSNQVVVAGSTQAGRLVVVQLTSAGRLDTHFGNAGEATISFPGRVSAGGGNGVALTPSGQVVVVGTEILSATRPIGDFAVARLTSAGRLDPRFGRGGEAVFGTGLNQGTAVAVQSNGRIVVAGTDLTHLTALRLTSTGRLDPTFGSAGTAGFLRSAISSGSAVSLAVAPGGRLIVASTSGQNFAVARLTNAGVLDTGFNTSGQVLTSVAGTLLMQTVTTLAQGINATTGTLNLPQTGAIPSTALSLPQTTVQTTTVGLPQTGVGIPSAGLSLPQNVQLPTSIFGSFQGNFSLPQTSFGQNSFVLPQGTGTVGTTLTTVQGARNNLQAGGVVVLPDGRIIVAGTSPSQTSTQVVLARLLG